LTRNRRHRIAYSDRRSPAAASSFAAPLLFALGDETGLLDGLPALRFVLLIRLLLLLVARPLPAALLFLLLALIGHVGSLDYIKDNASL
jgi:hypothetical protein